MVSIIGVRLFLAFYMAFVVVGCGAEAGHFTRLDGSRLHYDTRGDGQVPIVFVHGWACDSTFWRLQRPDMKTRYILLDLPGHGKSDIPRRMNWDIFARSVPVVMRPRANGTYGPAPDLPFDRTTAAFPRSRNLPTKRLGRPSRGQSQY